MAMAMGMPKLALVILVAAFLAGTKGDCEYRLKVKTGGWPLGGEEEERVWFLLYDDSHSGVTHWEDDRDGARFNRWSTDEFSFTDPKCIRPCRLVFGRKRQDWFCFSVDVTVSGDISYSKSFLALRRVPAGIFAPVDDCKYAAA